MAGATPETKTIKTIDNAADPTLVKVKDVKLGYRVKLDVRLHPLDVTKKPSKTTKRL